MDLRKENRFGSGERANALNKNFLGAEVDRYNLLLGVDIGWVFPLDSAPAESARRHQGCRLVHLEVVFIINDVVVVFLNELLVLDQLLAMLSCPS
jgi:hypothetical protein